MRRLVCWGEEMSRCPRRLLRLPPFLLPLPPPSWPRPSSRPVSSLPGPGGTPRGSRNVFVFRGHPRLLLTLLRRCDSRAPGPPSILSFSIDPGGRLSAPPLSFPTAVPDAAFSPEATGSSRFPRWRAVFSSAPPLPPSGLSSGRWPRIPMPEPAHRFACSAAAETEALSSGLPEPFPAL